MIPHVAKATGIYLNSMLAVTEAQRAGYDEAILLTDEGFVADGSGENVFVVKDGRIMTPPLSTSILPGITRATVIEIAQELGYVVEETNLIRTDLYLADEVFMVGTAAEVTPLREIDDQEIGVGPVTMELQQAYLATVRGQIEDRQHWLDFVPASRRGVTAVTRQVALSSPYLDEREEELVVEVLRSGRLSLGPWIDRFEELFAERVGAPYAAAVSSGTAGLHLLCRARRARAGRRGDHVAVLVRRVGELRDLRGRDAGLRGHRPAHAEPRSGRGRGRDHAAHEGGRSPSTSTATRASSTRSASCASATAWC